MRRCQLLERSKERVPPERRPTQELAGDQPENWQAALLFNIDGVIKFFGAGLFTEFEVAGETSSRTPSLCRSSLGGLPQVCPRCVGGRGATWSRFVVFHFLFVSLVGFGAPSFWACGLATCSRQPPSSFGTTWCCSWCDPGHLFLGTGQSDSGRVVTLYWRTVCVVERRTLGDDGSSTSFQSTEAGLFVTSTQGSTASFLFRNVTSLSASMLRRRRPCFFRYEFQGTTLVQDFTIYIRTGYGNVSGSVSLIFPI